MIHLVHFKFWLRGLLLVDQTESNAKEGGAFGTKARRWQKRKNMSLGDYMARTHILIHKGKK